MTKDIKIATLIITSNTYPAVRNTKSQKTFFFNEGFSKQLTFWYKAGYKEEFKDNDFKLVNNDLLINTDDGTLNMGLKTIMAFEWLEKNYEFDFVVRPTPSSYLNYQNLYKFIINNLMNKEFVYCGKIQNTNDTKGNRISFVSGSTLILNRNSVREIIKNKEKWNHAYWDDVALSILMKDLNINPQNSERFDVEGNPFKVEIPKNFYQYRCRCDNHYGYPRFLESFSLKILHNLVNKKEIHFIKKFTYWFLYEVSKLFYIYQFGWKSYQLLRVIMKKILPTWFYKLIKKLFGEKIENFKNIRFKF